MKVISYIHMLIFLSPYFHFRGKLQQPYTLMSYSKFKTAYVPYYIIYNAETKEILAMQSCNSWTFLCRGPNRHEKFYNSEVYLKLYIPLVSVILNIFWYFTCTDGCRKRSYTFSSVYKFFHIIIFYNYAMQVGMHQWIRVGFILPSLLPGYSTV